LFYGDNDTLYIADTWGRILYVASGEDDVDTLVHRFEDVNIKGDYVNSLTGDNKGNLYISSGYLGKGVTKYNLYTKSSEIIFTEPKDNSTANLTFYDGRIYVIAHKNLYSFKPDGSDVKSLIENNDGLSTNHGMVFYEKLNKFILTGIDDPTKLCLMEIDGTYTKVKFENENTNDILFIVVDNSGDLIVTCNFSKKINIK
jgi:hypothetical protein